MVTYMQGTRRLEEMIQSVRQLAYQETYSYTEGWSDNVVADIFNLALDRLYAVLTQIDNPPNIQEVIMDVVGLQSAYAIPQDVHMALRIMDVRFQYDGQPHMFITLRQSMIQDRFFYYSNLPDNYCIRNGQILLSPAPIQSRTQALIINYQKRMRKMDIRRGKVSGLLSANGTITGATQANPCEITTGAAHGLAGGESVSIQGVSGMIQLNGNIYTVNVTGVNTFELVGVDSSSYSLYTSGGYWFVNPMTFQLNFTTTSQKDALMQQNADSILDKIDWCCFTDRNGIPVVDAIPLVKYNRATKVLEADPAYVFPADQLVNFNTALSGTGDIYVVSGDYSSTHSELDRNCEDHLIEFAVLRLLRLQSAAEPTIMQLKAEEDVLKRLLDAYRRYRPAIVPIVWQQRSSMRRWF